MGVFIILGAYFQYLLRVPWNNPVRGMETETYGLPLLGFMLSTILCTC